MAASALLDTIINETINKSFLGSDVFDDSPLNGFHSNSQHNNADQTGKLLPDDGTGGPGGSPTAIANFNDQLDSLAQSSLQNVEMGHYEKLFWVLLFSIMVLIAAGGNTIVVYIVSTNKEMKSVTNYFLVNLSLADTMVSTLNVIFNFISMLISHWPFGKIYCKISNFIAILSISASVFTLTAISCDRYNAIIHPLRPRMSHSHAIAWILLIWTLSSALAMPNAIYSTLVEDRLLNDNVAVTCAMIWPDGRYPLSSYDHIYNIVVLVVTYLVPILTMAILYYKVGKELWGYEAIGENIDKQQRAIMAKKKIVKMMIVVVIIFALCWLPYHAFFVVNYYVPTIFQDVPLHYQRCYLFMYWLAMSNSMYNPIIIYFMNSNFRQEFKKILCLLFCCRTYNSQIRSSYQNNNNNNNTTNTNRLNCTQQIKRQVVQENLSRNIRDSSNPTLQASNETPTNVSTCFRDRSGVYLEGNDNEVKVVITSPATEDSNGSKDINSELINERQSSVEWHRGTSCCNGIDSKLENEEEEPFILSGHKADITDLKLVGEKLIDFTNSTNNNAITGSDENIKTKTQACNNRAHEPAMRQNDKVWI